MTVNDCIKQLESLRAHCYAMDDGKLDSTDCWGKDVQALDMALDTMKAGAGLGFVCVQGSPDAAQTPEVEWLPELVTEICPHCESEVTLEWDVEARGYKAFCPVCGGRLMLCDECQHRGPDGEHTGDCDYNPETDTCRFNQPGDGVKHLREWNIRRIVAPEAGRLIAYANEYGGSVQYGVLRVPKNERPDRYDYWLYLPEPPEAY